MKLIDWERLKGLRRMLVTDRPEPTHQAERIVAMQRDVVLPSKAGVILVVFYYLFLSDWNYETPTTRLVVQDTLKDYFLVYVLCNCLGALFFYRWRRLPPGLFQWLAFTTGLLDGLFITGLTIVTGGFDSILFWVFPCLIVLNALSIPLAVPQIVLNLLLSLFYLSAGLILPGIGEGTAMIAVPGRSVPAIHATNQIVHGASEPAFKLRKLPRSNDVGDENLPAEISMEASLLRVSVLWLLTLCCYGAQVLVERQRIALEEAEEFAARENQLHSAGRLAAEFAHQIKNPLAVINNAAFSLQRSLRTGKGDSARQIEIIQEEVARADRVITQITGYAQLSEGRVEKLDAVAELDRAIAQVFPPAVPTGINIHREYAAHFPPLLMQRGHLSEILVNLLQNARETIGQTGNVFVTAKCHRDYSIEISVRDDGHGVPPDKTERIFEAYFTTKEKGTGLGLAIVKHNVELYGGTVRLESKSGHGATFVVFFPAKALMKLSKT
ncbi:MAG: HAMP domain-containing sensor histidine kinase [Verrucomicrobiota bacterium]